MRYSGLTVEELKALERFYITKRDCAQVYKNLGIGIPEPNVIEIANQNIKLINNAIDKFNGK